MVFGLLEEIVSSLMEDGRHQSFFNMTIRM